MELAAAVLITAAIFAWGTVSARLERADLSAPIVFTLVGALLAALGLVHAPSESAALKPLVEVTLVWVLFADAARIRIQDFRQGMGQYVRLLGVGLPLTILAGWLLAVWLFPGMGLWLALLVAAALAPTDAALGIPVVTNPAVPSRIRRLITVESGLNDGIATPAVTALIAAAATVIGAGTIEDNASSPGTAALVDLLGGVAIGVLVGYLGGVVVTWARAEGWIAPGGRRIAVLMLAVLAFLVAEEVGVNYFVAAFVGGIAFRAGIGADDEEATELPELIGRVLALAVWFVFGAGLLLDGLELVDWRIALYSVLSLTVVRMAPVAVSMIGAGFSGPATAFIGWFGPRGLASVVFGLLIVEELPAGDPRVQTVLSTVVLTVLLSVLAHGISGRPLSAWMRRKERGSASADEDTQTRPPSTFGRPRAGGDHGGYCSRE